MESASSTEPIAPLTTQPPVNTFAGEFPTETRCFRGSISERRVSGITTCGGQVLRSRYAYDGQGEMVQ
jgi:hypothetical protein